MPWQKLTRENKLMSWDVGHDMMLSSRSRRNKHQHTFVHSSSTSTVASKIKNESQRPRPSLPLKAIWQIAALGQTCFLQVLLLFLASSNGTSGAVNRPSTVLFIWKNVFSEKRGNANAFIWAFIGHMYRNTRGVVVSKCISFSWCCTHKCVFSCKFEHIHFQQPVCWFLMGTKESKAPRSRWHCDGSALHHCIVSYSICMGSVLHCVLHLLVKCTFNLGVNMAPQRQLHWLNNKCDCM